MQLVLRARQLVDKRLRSDDASGAPCQGSVMRQPNPIALLEVLETLKETELPPSLLPLAHDLRRDGLTAQSGERWRLTETGRAMIQRGNATVH